MHIMITQQSTLMCSPYTSALLLFVCIVCVCACQSTPSQVASQASGACLKGYMFHCNGCRAVAASDINKYAWTPPLQDNVEIWLNSLKAAYPWTEILWQHEWINIKHKLVSLIALAFSVLFDQVGSIALAACNVLKQLVFAKGLPQGVCHANTHSVCCYSLCRPKSMQHVLPLT